MDEDFRRIRREFIRTHHPDRGGDAAEFVAGLAALEQSASTGAATSPAPEEPVRIHVIVDPPWPVSLFSAFLRRRRRRHAPPRVR